MRDFYQDRSPGIGTQEGTLKDKGPLLPAPMQKGLQNKKSLACLNTRGPFSQGCPSPSFDPQNTTLSPSPSHYPHLGTSHVVPSA